MFIIVSNKKYSNILNKIELSKRELVYYKSELNTISKKFDYYSAKCSLANCSIDAFTNSVSFNGLDWIVCQIICSIP